MHAVSSVFPTAGLPAPKLPPPLNGPKIALPLDTSRANENKEVIHDEIRPFALISKNIVLIAVIARRHRRPPPLPPLPPEAI
jgi:hypothetical protein